MTSKQVRGFVRRDLSCRDAVSRVARQGEHSVDGYSSGVASSNARSTRIPVSEVV
jgi:hypothetical protein